MQVVRGQYAQRVDRLRTHLKALNPELILQRGYSITVIKKTGEIVKAASQVKGGEKLVTKVADGVIESIAKDPRQRELFE
jgi:exodeoxyribonuclease VII large subunit